MRDSGNRKTTLYPDVKRFDRSRNYIKGRQSDNDILHTIGSPGNVVVFKLWITINTYTNNK